MVSDDMVSSVTLAVLQELFKLKGAAAKQPRKNIAATSPSTVTEFKPSASAWSAGPDLPSPRSGAACGVLHGALVLAGGANSEGDYVDTVTVFDSDQSAWISLPPIPGGARYGAATCVSGDGKLIVAGGMSSSASSAQPLATVAALHVPNGDWTKAQWHSLPDMPEGRYAAAAACESSTGRVIVAGGLGRGDEELRSVVAYDMGSGSWSGTAVADLPETRYSAAAGVVGGNVVVAGGVDGSGRLRSALRYESGQNRWVGIADMPGARVGGSAAVVHGGKLVVAGGQDQDYARVRSVVEYDAQANAWRALPAMPSATGAAGIGLLRTGMLMVAGGWDTNNRRLKSVLQLDPQK